MNTAKYKDQLEMLREALLNEDLAYEELHSEKVSDSLDAATLDINQSLKTKLLKRKSGYMGKIEAALRRIADGTYGECEWCGDDISEKRLKARLTAQLCITCKEDQEREEKEKTAVGGIISKGNME